MHKNKNVIQIYQNKIPTLKMIDNDNFIFFDKLDNDN